MSNSEHGNSLPQELLLYSIVPIGDSTDTRFYALYNEHAERLHKRILCHIRDHHQAEDVEQLTWIKAALFLSRIPPERAVTYGWLWMIAQNTATDVWRHEGRHTKHTAFSLDDAPPCLYNDPTFQAGDIQLPGIEEQNSETILIEQENTQEDSRLIQMLFEPLTELERETLRMRFAGEKASEQAKRLGISAKSVQDARKDGMQKLHRQLKRRATYRFGRPVKEVSA